MKKGRGATWFKYGCFGCLGILLLIIIFVAIISGVAWNQVKKEDPQDKVVSHALPEAGAAEGDDEGEDEGPGAVTTESPEPGRSAGIGLVRLDLANGEFHIEPARAGEPLRIETSYDATTYSFEEGFEESTEEGIAWVYNARFHRTSNPVIAVLSQLFGATRPELTVYLPRGVLMDLVLDLKEGGTNVELGGLWLRDASIDFARGGFNVEISEPLQEPAESLSLRGSMGGFNAEGIGNASPRTFDIQLNMGGMNLDLRGAWQRDADINLRWDMGGGSVRLPDNVRILGVDGDGDPEPTGEVTLPALRFKLKGKMDDMKFVGSGRR